MMWPRMYKCFVKYGLETMPAGRGAETIPTCNQSVLNIR